jgi:ribonucleotide reductase beta subunit family protein with ferritin-like domain
VFGTLFAATTSGLSLFLTWNNVFFFGVRRESGKMGTNTVTSKYSFDPEMGQGPAFDFYKKSVACFWTVEEVDLEGDMATWRKMTLEEQRFVKNVLAFFASADIVVADNVHFNFSREFQEREIKFFYDFQTMIENIHSEMYSSLLYTYSDSREEVVALLRHAEESTVTSEKVKWMERWSDPSLPLGHRVVAFAAVEGIFFSASFCAIFWLKKRGLLPGLCFSNELISRDEGLHRDFACMLKREGFVTCDDEVVRSIVREAVDVEERFVSGCLPVSLIGMNAPSMAQYVRCVADHLLVSLGTDPLFRATNPFDWMQMISLNGKTNFFEKRVSEYRKAGVGMGGKRFSVSDDF